MKFREALIILALSIYCFQALLLPRRGRFRSGSHSEEKTRLLDGIEKGKSSSSRSDVESSWDNRAEAHGYSDVFTEVKREQAAQVFDHENWKTPYTQSFSQCGRNGKIDTWLNALLYKSRAQLQEIWLTGGPRGSHKDRFSHQVDEIPLVDVLLALHQDRQEELLKAQLSVFFQRINTLDLTKRNPIQEASIVDFILVLACITETNQRASRNVDPFSTMIQEYIMPQLSQLEQKLAQSGRNDMQSFIIRLKELWRSRR